MRFAAILSVLSLAALGSAQDYPPPGRACGFKIAPCPADQHCKPTSKDCADVNRCAGTCQWKNQYPDCGGHRPNPPTCKRGSTCQDDPRKGESCGQKCDIPGICLPKKKLPTCRGIQGKSCPKGTYCYDKPGDGCDPNDGGADCIGVCL